MFILSDSWPSQSPCNAVYKVLLLHYNCHPLKIALEEFYVAAVDKTTPPSLGSSINDVTQFLKPLLPTHRHTF